MDKCFEMMSLYHVWRGTHHILSSNIKCTITIIKLRGEILSAKPKKGKINKVKKRKEIVGKVREIARKVRGLSHVRLVGSRWWLRGGHYG